MKGYNKLKVNIILLVFSIVIGLLVSMQIETHVLASQAEPTLSIESYELQIEKTQEEIKKLSTSIKDKELELNLLMDSDNKDENLIKLLEEDINKNKIYSGFSNMKGPGVEITMYDNMDSDIIGLDVNDDIIHDIDILNILNDLKIAGAEAISINNQRIMSTTEIKCGGPIIRINGKSFATPFIIRAVGEPNHLMAAVTAPGTYGDILKNVYQLYFEPKINEDIFIPSYDGKFRYIHAKPVEVGG